MIASVRLFVITHVCAVDCKILFPINPNLFELCLLSIVMVLYVWNMNDVFFLWGKVSLQRCILDGMSVRKCSTFQKNERSWHASFLLYLKNWEFSFKIFDTYILTRAVTRVQVLNFVRTFTAFRYHLKEVLIILTMHSVERNALPSLLLRLALCRTWLAWYLVEDLFSKVF